MRASDPFSPIFMDSADYPILPFAPDLEQRRAWARYLRPLRLVVGQCLFRQGDPADGLYFLETGSLAVWLELPGGERARLGEFGPGQCIGEMAPYRREARSATIECVAPALLWSLPTDELDRVELEEPALAVGLHRQVAGRLAERVAHSNTHVKAPLAQLAHLIHEISASNFVSRPEEESRIAAIASRTDEVGAIAEAVRELRRRLAEHVAELRSATAARERVESELRIAGRIQMSFLPGPLTPAEATRIDFAAVSRPAREAGGDLYDGFFLDSRRFFFVVGDVSGKGIPAALFMAVTAMCLRALAREPGTLDGLVTRVNDLLCQRNDTQQFVTLCAGILDTTDGELIWVNCGHPGPLLVGAGEGVRTLDEGRGPPLGVFEGLSPECQRLRLRAGEVLLIYTDGVTEAVDLGGALFGEERLASLFASTENVTAAAAVRTVLHDVERFSLGAPPADDLTMLALGLAQPLGASVPVTTESRAWSIQPKIRG